MLSHVRTWRSLKGQQLEPQEGEYRWRQTRRRIQTSAMLMVLAAALAATHWVTRPPWAFLALLVGILVLLVWVTLLAVADIVATKYYYGRLRHRYLMEEVKLQAELRRLQAVRGDGRPNGKGTPGHGPQKGGNRPRPGNGH